jgi:hypothetical protein
MTVAERVADGVALLDEMNPGWWDGIDLETLRIEYADSCVLGQVYGSFAAGCMLLSGREAGVSDWEATHGFGQIEIDESWQPLQDAWFGVISARQLAAMPSHVVAEEAALD